jgi:hypothetical protein
MRLLATPRLRRGPKEDTIMGRLIARGACIAAIAGGLALIACNSKVAECNKLIEKINGAVTNMEKASKTKPSKENSKEMGEMAKVAETGKKDIESVALTDEKLKGYQKDFAGKMQAAADKDDMPGMTAALNEINALEKEESTLVTNANNYCQGK